MSWDRWKDVKEAIAAGFEALGALGATASGVVAATFPFAATIAGAAFVTGVAYNYAKSNYGNSTNNNNSDNNHKSHTVYALVDNNSMAQYVGRTNSPLNRATAHSNNPYKSTLKMRIIKDNLDYFEARGVEQNLIEYCNVLNRGDFMHNQINGIRLGTDNYYDFTRIGSLAFDHSLIPIRGDKCYIDPTIYKEVR